MSAFSVLDREREGMEGVSPSAARRRCPRGGIAVAYPPRLKKGSTPAQAFLFGGALGRVGGATIRRLAALFSGGKDSTHAIFLAEQAGFTVERLVTARPARDDSYMFHTPNLDLARLAAEAMGIPLIEVPVSGEPEAEVADLERGLRPLAESGEVDGLLAGAIASDYQWARVAEVGHRLGLASYTPLWRVRPELVMRDALASGLKFMIVAAQTEGLTPEWLGHTFDGPLLEQLFGTAKTHRFNAAGEGGEFETLVTDGPLFGRRIRIDAYHVEVAASSSRMVVDEAALTEQRGPV